MTVCSKYAPGEGRFANRPSLRTSCLVDYFAIPAATWLYIILIAIMVLIITLRGPRSDSSNAPLFASQSAKSPTHHDDETDTPQTSTKSKGMRTFVKISAVVYVILVIAMFAMVVLEIARMVASKLDLGLLPFTLPGILIAGLVRWFAGRPTLVHKWGMLLWMNVVYWILLVVMYSVGTGVLDRLSTGDARLGRDEYPRGDQVTDRATILGVAIVLSCLEIFGIAKGGWRSVQKATTK